MAEQHDARAAVLRRGEPAELLLHSDEVGRQSLNEAVVKHVRQHPRHGDPVLQCKAGAGGRLAAVVEHPPLAVGNSGQVGGVEVEHATGLILCLAVRDDFSR